MHARITLAAALATAALLTAGCSSQPTKDEMVKQCVAAIKARPEGDKAKPEACKPLPHDDYVALVASHVLRENGWIDENGDPDMEKLLEDAEQAGQP